MALYRFQTVFTGVAGSPAYNSLYFIDAGDTDLDGQSTSIKGFWHSLLQFSDDACIASFDGEVQEINPATGQIVATQQADPWTDGGQNTGTPLPPATQGLLRMTTGVYESGRQLKGRIFIPYLTTPAGPSVPASGTVSVWSTAGNNLRANTVANGMEWVVWSRTHGVYHVVSGTSVWGQYAVQRSRRD